MSQGKYQQVGLSTVDDDQASLNNDFDESSINNDFDDQCSTNNDEDLRVSIIPAQRHDETDRSPDCRPSHLKDFLTKRQATYFLKLTVLVAVTMQNTGYALIRRYSRGQLKETYSTSSALLAMEVAKLLLSASQIAFGGHESDVPAGSCVSKYAWLICHSWKMLVPAVIYLVMNILGFVALGHLDAATFSIVAQMKVFTTAIFSVMILGRQLRPRKWRALGLLVLGVLLISNEALPPGARASFASGNMPSDADAASALRSFAIGMAASFGDVLLSGFVSIYFEMVLKSKSETFSVWDRNFQLAFWSALIYAPIMLYDNPTDPFTGWSTVTVGCAMVGALGGVLVALSIKHTDSIAKTIATTGSIVLTTVLNAAFMQGPFTLPIWAGALIVVISVFNYNDNGDPDP